MFVLGIIMTGLGVAVARDLGLYFGVIGVLFFGAGTAIIAVRIVKPATLIADEHGVHETAWPHKNRTIRWDEVVRFFLAKSPRRVYIEFTASGMRHHTDYPVMNALAELLAAEQLGELVDSGRHWYLALYPVPADQLADQLEQLRLRYTATR